MNIEHDIIRYVILPLLVAWHVRGAIKGNSKKEVKSWNWDHFVVLHVDEWVIIYYRILACIFAVIYFIPIIFNIQFFYANWFWIFLFETMLYQLALIKGVNGREKRY